MRIRNNKEIKIWAENRGLTFFDKVSRWRLNLAGGMIRIFEKLYFGHPLFVLLQENGIEHISHLKSVERHLSSSYLNELRELPNRRGYFEPKSLNSVAVDLMTGAIKLDSGHVLVQNIGIQPFLSGSGYFQLRKFLKFQGEVFEGNYIVLPNQVYYYHFLVEELPKLLRALSEDESIQVLSNSLQPEYVLQILQKFENRVKFSDRKFLKVQCLVNFQNADFDLKNSAFEVRKYLSNNSSPIDSSRKIFVLRGSKARSDHELENIISNLLKPYGFLPINASSLSIFDQAKLFQNVTHVVGLHGGGLSNLVFTRENTHVLEIFNTLYRSSCFQNMCNVLNLNYTRVDLLSDDKVDQISQWACES